MTGPLDSFLDRLVEIQAEEARELPDSANGPPRDVVSARLGQGVPALAFDDLEIDWRLARRTFAKLTKLLRAHCKMPAGLAIDAQAARAWFEDRGWRNNENGEDSGIAALLFSATLRPFLAWQAESVLQGIDLDVWHRGRCPACGGTPDFAYLARDTGARWLMCSRCDTCWPYQRIQCPFCDNTDQDKLSFFTDRGGMRRLYVCERCKRYLKAVDLRKAPEEMSVYRERMTQLDMDWQASGLRYVP